MPDSQLKILLVEDNDLDVRIIERLMRRMSLDHPVIRASNGEEALKILRSDCEANRLLPPFIMLVDINMPRMNGFELLEELAADPTLAAIPTYILSTSTSPHDIRKATQYQILDYLVKPISESDLIRILET
jgi:CheY-like chemotaxis protein